MRAKISEIFKSIQGEGIYQGRQQIFIRFFGCNLNCSFCDTKLNYYRELAISDILKEISILDSYHSIALTGGEPLLQIEVLKELTPALKKEGKIIYLETNGTLEHNLSEIIDYLDIIAMDFKLPSSTGIRDFWFRHREFLKIASEKAVFVKTVIGQRSLIEDMRIALAIIKEVSPHRDKISDGVNKDIPFVLQPENPYENLLVDKLSYFEKVCKQNGIEAKIIPQMHKALGVK